MKPQYHRRTLGAILAIPIGTQEHCFALTLPDADFAFFGPEAANDATTKKLFTHSPLFRVAVNKSAWVTGRWRKLATLEVPDAILAPAPKFIQDKLNPSNFQLYVGGEIRPATRSECEGLERASVWDPEHVEQRLRDHFAGVPNVWVEQLRIK
jgi:hypothetical protein